MNLRTIAGQEAAALQRDGRGRMLLVIASAWGLLVGTRMLYPVLLPYLRESFALDLTTAGLLVTILWLGSALGQLPSGVLADRYSERLVMATGTVIVTLAVGAVLIAPTTILLFIATGVIGIGISLYPIARITILSDLYPDRIGTALGLTMATGDLGQTVLPPIAGVLAGAFAWQLGLGFVVPLLFIVTAGLLFVLPRKPRTESAVDEFSLDGFRYVSTQLRRPSMIFMTLVLFLFIFIWQSFSAFYPTYLAVEKGLSPPLAAVVFGLFFAIGVLVKPAAGTAYDRIGMRASLLLVLVGPVGGLAMLPFLEGFWPLVGVTAVLGSMLGTGAVTQSYLSDAFPADMRGTGLGVIRTTAATLGALGPVLFGAVADRGFFDEGYLLLAGILVVVILITVRMPTAR